MTDIPAAAFRTVGRSEGVPDNYVVPYYLQDRKWRIAIARVEGHLFAFDDLCTCGQAACPLSGGLLLGTTIMCQCHGSCFDVRTGTVLNGPATEALNIYEVQEADGNIRMRV